MRPRTALTMFRREAGFPLREPGFSRVWADRRHFRPARFPVPSTARAIDTAPAAIRTHRSIPISGGRAGPPWPRSRGAAVATHRCRSRNLEHGTCLPVRRTAPPHGCPDPPAESGAATVPPGLIEWIPNTTGTNGNDKHLLHPSTPFPTRRMVCYTQMYPEVWITGSRQAQHVTRITGSGIASRGDTPGMSSRRTRRKKIHPQQIRDLWRH